MMPSGVRSTSAAMRIFPRKYAERHVRRFSGENLTKDFPMLCFG
jgi:hypothetical protein